MKAARILGVLLTTIVLLGTFLMITDAETYEDFTYIPLSGGGARITAYNGAGGNVEIPSKI
ncbi:MAG: hypothetical protein IJD82_08950, partial [Clostridia bacterium]|nr:hypothetical protein [Clostridia bacterium]